MNVIVRKVGFKDPAYTNIYVGRPSGYKSEYGYNASVMGNPHYMAYESMRDEVCDKFDADWMWIKTDPRISKIIKQMKERIKSRGQKFALICYCYPKRCHAETIAREIEGGL
jgi:hypothetical protein